MTAGARILVVDDEVSVCRFLVGALERGGYDVAYALDGEAALRSLEAEGFALAFLDWLLPDVDGLDLLAEIRRRWPGVAVVVVTGYASPATAVEAMRRGARDFLTKPMTVHDVTSAAARALAAVSPAPADAEEEERP